MSLRHEYWLEAADNDLEIAGYCDSCGSEILVGDKLFESDTEFLCMDCVQANALELLEDYLSGNFITAEAF